MLTVQVLILPTRRLGRKAPGQGQTAGKPQVFRRMAFFRPGLGFLKESEANPGERKPQMKKPATPKYLNQVLAKLNAKHFEPGSVEHITVLHDDDCSLLKSRGPCDCSPAVELGKPDEARETYRARRRKASRN